MSERKEKTLMVITGVLTGLINGFFGGGGGMVVVPLLIFLLKKKPKVAHATAILIILPISVVSGIMYIAFGHYKFSIGLPVIIGTIVGGLIGAILLKKLPPKWVIIIFSLVMLVAGVKMLFF